MTPERMKEALAALRAEIDAADDRLAALLRERMSLVRRVGELKSASGVRGSFIRSGREADILRRIPPLLEGDYRPAAAGHIWRAIISSSLACEQAFTVAASEDEGATAWWLAREYFGGAAPVQLLATGDEVIAAVSEDRHSVGALAVSDRGESWWLRPREEKNALYVFACMPFIAEAGSAFPPVFAFTKVKPEHTERDAALLALDFRDAPSPCSADFVRHAALDAGWKASLLCVKPEGALISSVGHTAEDEATAPASFAGAGVKVRLLGRYALPEVHIV